MSDPSNRTFVCGVLFLDIVEYSKKPVIEQLMLKQRFNAFLVSALGQIAVSDRVVLDTGDGAAISFLGSPEDALLVGIAAREAVAAEKADDTPPLQVRMGINLGPVRLIKDINGRLNILGDGINVAQRVMSFGEPGALLVSRSYHEVVSRMSDDFSKLFLDAGTRTDEHVRTHAVYSVRTLPRNASLIQPGTTHTSAKVGTRASDKASQYAALLSDSQWGINRRLLFLVPLIAIMIVSAGVFLRIGMGKALDVEARQPENQPASQVTTRRTKPAQGTAVAKKQEATDSSTVPKPLIGKGKIVLAITPWGDVFVDGRERGISPPLKSLTLTPGLHMIEIKNSVFPVHKKMVDVKSGATLTIRHKF